MLDDVMLNLFTWVITFVANVMPVLNLDSAFMTNFDTGLSAIIDLFKYAGYFIPLGALIDSIFIVILVDKYKSILNTFKWIAGLFINRLGV